MSWDFVDQTHNRLLDTSYDALGRMTHWKDSVTGLEETISYDAVGNQVRVQGDGGGTSIDHGTDFDAANRVVAQRDHAPWWTATPTTRRATAALTAATARPTPSR